MAIRIQKYTRGYLSRKQFMKRFVQIGFQMFSDGLESDENKWNSQEVSPIRPYKDLQGGQSSSGFIIKKDIDRPLNKAIEEDMKV